MTIDRREYWKQYRKKNAQIISEKRKGKRNEYHKLRYRKLCEMQGKTPPPMNIPRKIHTLEGIRAEKRAWSKTPRGRYSSLKARAKRFNREVEISLDEFTELINQSCHYCGNSDAQIGIDRKDSKLGYLVSNCLPCCKECNSKKRDLDYDEFVSQMSS